MRDAPQIYLVSPLLAAARPFLDALEAALAGGEPVAALLLRLGPGEERARINLVKEIAPVAQAKGVAVLVEDDVTVAIRGGADGVHVTGGLAAIRAALERAKPERIVGAGNLRSRHDAMEAGEAGVDYVMFGEPVEGRPPPALAAVEERARWWAEVFEAPGVAYAPDADAAVRLAATGIDFLARPVG